VYTMDGKPLRESVTSVAHSCQAEFVREDALSLMRMSKKERWPRLKYTKDAQLVLNVEDVTNERGLLAVVDDKTVAVARPGDFDDVSGSDLVDALLSTMIVPSHSSGPVHPVLYSFERGMTDAEIFASWDANGEDKRNRGTEAHLQMQLYVEGRPCRLTDPEVVVGKRFLDMFPSEWEGFRCEWEIVYPEADLAGSIDLVIRNMNTGHISIVDYKRSDKLEQNLTGFKRMSHPLSHLDDCDGATYSLQLSIYQYILESVYGQVVDDRILITLHPDKPFCTSVPYLKEEVEYLMGVRRARVKALLDCPHKCPLTGVPLHTAVFAKKNDSEECVSVDRKSALIYDYRIVADDAKTSEKVKIWEETHTDEVPVPTFMNKWKSSMPRGGIWPAAMVDDT